MRAISAAEAVSPAIQRTRDFLFRPFRWSTFLKLGLVAILTEGIGSNLRSTQREYHSSGTAPVVPSFHLSPQQIAIGVVALLFALVVSMAVFYLITRLRFAFFHCLIHNTREIGPGWRFYRSPANRFFGLSVVVGLCFLLLAALLLLPFVAGLWQLIQQIPSGGQPPVMAILLLVLPLLPIFFLLAVLGVATDVVLRDWMLPHFALEDASSGEAWTSVWARFRQEKRQFLLYILLRVILPVIAMMALFVILILPGMAVFGSLGVIEYSIHQTFATPEGGTALVGILLEAFFGLIAFLFFLLASICLGGPVSTGIREYALLFYGSRYQVLGDILAPPAPPASLPPLPA